jgi:hypothetical protein
MLRKLLPRRGVVRYLAHVVGRGRDLFAATCESDLEGSGAAKHESHPTPPPVSDTTK